MPNAAQIQLLETKLSKIRVPRSEISVLITNLEILEKNIIKEVLAPEQFTKLS